MKKSKENQTFLLVIVGKDFTPHFPVSETNDNGYLPSLSLIVFLLSVQQVEALPVFSPSRVVDPD
jgi:hypothetical protein